MKLRYVSALVLVGLGSVALLSGPVALAQTAKPGRPKTAWAGR